MLLKIIKIDTIYYVIDIQYHAFTRKIEVGAKIANINRYDASNDAR